MALILPAKSHTQVIIHAVAARDKARATAFAKKHDIPVVKNSYEGASYVMTIVRS
jgi:predicted dehydrogenase